MDKEYVVVDYAETGWRSWVERRPWLCFCVASAVWLAILYHGVLSAPFVYDDLGQIANNPVLDSWRAVWTQYVLMPAKFSSGFLGSGGLTYRPVFWIALALEKHLFGGEPGWFHFISLLLHWTDGLLLFSLLRRLTMSTVVAGLAAMLWLGMPVNSEAVAWISAQLYPLSTGFLLLSLIAALSYVRGGERSWLATFAVAAVMADFTHEQGVLLVAFLLLGFVMLKEDQRSRRWAALVSLSLMANVVYCACRWAVGTHAAGGPHQLSAVGEVFWRYMQLVMLPVRMSVERSTDVPRAAQVSVAILAWVALIALIIGVVRLRGRVVSIAAAIGVLLIAVLPYCGFVFIYQGMAERYLYTASIGIAVAIAAAVAKLRTTGRKMIVACLMVWVGWSAWRVLVRVQDWQDPIALYEHSLEASPRSATLTLNYGAALQSVGRQTEAESQYRRVISLVPNDSSAYVDLESLDIEEGRLEDAIAMYKQATTVNPNDANAYFDLGVMFQMRGQTQDALAFYKKVLQLKPGDPQTLEYLQKLRTGTQ